MKQTKSKVSLNEEDSINDIINSIKQLISLYATAVYEGNSKAVRKTFLDNLQSAAQDQYTAYMQLTERDYYTPPQAQKPQIDNINDKYKKSLLA
jgi:spore coat protein CotF